MPKSPRAKTNLDLYNQYEPSDIDPFDRPNTQMNKLQANDAAAPNGDYDDEKGKRGGAAGQVRMGDGKG